MILRLLRLYPDLSNLNISELDNLNSINDCISKTDYTFAENFTFTNGLLIENFAGVGFDSDPMIIAESSLGFGSGEDDEIVNIYLNNSCIFNNIKNAKIFDNTQYWKTHKFR